MTDTEKVHALTELLADVMFTLEMKQYDVEDPCKSHQCEVEADQFRQKMMDILHGT